MDEQAKKLGELIESSDKILITSHISPDPDAVSSVLLFGTTLAKNFLNKKIEMVLEEKPVGLNFLNGYSDLKIASVLETLAASRPDLLVILDANSFGRISRTAGDAMKDYIGKNKVATAIIDHHQPDGKDDADVYINQGSPAVAQDVYEVLFKSLNLSNPEGYAVSAMTGIYADTGGFAYDNPRHTETLKLVDDLISAGASIEKIKDQLFRYSQKDMLVVSELAKNVGHNDDYTYSYISDEFIESWLTAGNTGGELHSGTEPFVNSYLRNIDGRKWGFIVYKNLLQGEGIYSASFRAIAGAKDVSIIAAKLGGGGHKGAAGAKFQADSVNGAIELVEKAVLEP